MLNMTRCPPNATPNSRYGSCDRKCVPDIRVAKRFASGADQGDEPKAERPDAEDRTVLLVVSCQESANVPSPHLEGIAGDRQSRHFRYFLRGPSGLRGGSGRLDRPDALPDRASHQIEPGNGVDSLLRVGQLVPRQDAFEHAAGRRKADDEDVARLRDVLAEDRPHHPRLDVLGGLSVDHRIAAGTCDQPGQKHEPVGLGLQDAVCDQPFARPCADGAASPRRAHDPVGGVVRFGFAGNVLQGGIEQVVVHRLRIDQEEALRIGVDTVLERQVRQHGAGNHDVPLMRRERVSNAAALGIDDEQQDFFGNGQHVLTMSSTGSMATRLIDLTGSRDHQGPKPIHPYSAQASGTRSSSQTEQTESLRLYCNIITRRRDGSTCAGVLGDAPGGSKPLSIRSMRTPRLRAPPSGTTADASGRQAPVAGLVRRAATDRLAALLPLRRTLRPLRSTRAHRRTVRTRRGSGLSGAPDNRRRFPGTSDGCCVPWG